MSFCFRRKNWFIDMWEEKLLYMSAFGILKKIRMTSVPDRVIPKPREELKPLTMEPLVLAFLLFAFGYSISITVFVFEVFEIHRRLHSFFK